VLQVNIAVAPYTVKVPILFPFGGDGRPPQEITRKKPKQLNKLKYENTFQNFLEWKTIYQFTLSLKVNVIGTNMSCIPQ